MSFVEGFINTPYIARALHVLRLTLLPEPALLVGVEEGVHEVVAVVLGELERLLLYAVVDTLGEKQNNFT